MDLCLLYPTANVSQYDSNRRYEREAIRARAHVGIRLAVTALKRVCECIRIVLSYMVDDVYVVLAARVPVIKLRARVPEGHIINYINTLSSMSRSAASVAQSTSVLSARVHQCARARRAMVE
jgi:hypothetical protein